MELEVISNFHNWRPHGGLNSGPFNPNHSTKMLHLFIWYYKNTEKWVSIFHKNYASKLKLSGICFEWIITWHAQNPMSAHMLDQLTATVDQSMIKFHSHYSKDIINNLKSWTELLSYESGHIFILRGCLDLFCLFKLFIIKKYKGLPLYPFWWYLLI